MLHNRRRRPADVGMFPGWAGSVLWVHGPLDYPGLGLPDALVADLRRWDLAWSRTAGPDADRPASRRERRRHDHEGRRLARQVAEALGESLVVELRLERRVLSRVRHRSRGPASAPAAAAVVLARQADAVGEQARVRRRLTGGRGEWRADAPPGPEPR